MKSESEKLLSESIEKLKAKIRANLIRLGMIAAMMPVLAFAQVREPVRQTIFYHVVSGNNVQKEGQILVYSDTLHAFDMTWTIQRKHVFKTDGGDKILQAVINLTYKEQSATLLVMNRKAVFIVPGLRDIEMVQLTHEGFRYDRF